MQLGDRSTAADVRSRARSVEVQEHRQRNSIRAIGARDLEALVLDSCADVADVITSHDGLGDVYQITGLVEKPPVDEAPSSLAIIGRYVLPATIFGAIVSDRMVRPIFTRSRGWVSGDKPIIIAIRR